MINIYGIKTCSTVRKAIKFCKDNNLEHTFVDFRATPLENDKVKYFASKVDINLLFNNRGTKYKDLVPQVENELDAIAEFERAFEMSIYNTSLRSFTKMFSFATIVGITKLTSFEVRNLAAIAFAVEQKIPTETTMSKLILEQE